MRKFFQKARVFAALLAAVTLAGAFTAILPAAMTVNGDTKIFPVDSVNGTRWADTMCVYKDRPTTQQNEWGWNVVVSAEGVVTQKIDGGDIKGKNLAVPEGGFVLSGTGDIGKEMFANIEVGDHAFFDEYGMRVLTAKGDVDPFYNMDIPFTHYNTPRYSNYLVVYNKGGTKTGTNGYGFEAVVNAEGYVVSAGGNDNLVPEGGFVISAIEPADKNLLQIYCIPGAKCVISGKTIQVTYDETMVGSTVAGEITLLKEELAAAKDQLRLIDYAGLEKSINALDPASITTLAQRDAMLKEIDALRIAMIESRDVEVRGVWYVPLERKEEDIYEVVAEMQRLGINQLNLGVIDSGKSIVKVSDEHPFTTDSRVRRLDILGTYVKACKEYGLEIVVSVPTFYGCGSEKNPHWIATTNKPSDTAEKFASPANEEFVAAMMEYLEHIVRHYDIDGIQYDYIRYPYFDGTTDYGYDEASKKLFAEETGLDESVVDEIATQLRSHPNWNDWVNFKVNLIHKRVQQFTEMIRSYRPDIYISAAVANDTGKELYCQDSSVWMENGWVDGIYPMSYAEGIMGNATKKFSGYLTDKTFLVMGNGAYLSLTFDEMFLQTNQTAVHGADGIAYFEWGAYVDHGYAKQFAETVFKKPALSFTQKESESIKALVGMAKQRLELWCELNGKTNDSADLFEKDLQAIYDGMKKYTNDPYLLQDIELALRIEKFSKESYKDGDYLIPLEKEEESSAPEESVSEDSAVSEGTSAPAPAEGGSFPWWILLCGLAVIAAAVAVILMVRKK